MNHALQMKNSLLRHWLYTMICQCFYFRNNSRKLDIKKANKFLILWVISTMAKFRSSRPEVFCKKGVLKNFAKFTWKYLCQSLFFNKVAKKETLSQLFSCKFCRIVKNTFFHRIPLVAASASWNIFYNE